MFIWHIPATSSSRAIWYGYKQSDLTCFNLLFEQGTWIIETSHFSYFCTMKNNNVKRHRMKFQLQYPRHDFTSTVRIATPIVIFLYTVQCRYNAINFLPNPHNRHPIARPWGRGMVWLLWFWSLIYVLLLSSQCRWYYREKLDHIIMALDYIFKYVGVNKCWIFEQFSF